MKVSPPPLPHPFALILETWRMLMELLKSFKQKNVSRIKKGESLTHDCAYVTMQMNHACRL